MKQYNFPGLCAGVKMKGEQIWQGKSYFTV